MSDGQWGSFAAQADNAGNGNDNAWGGADEAAAKSANGGSEYGETAAETIPVVQNIPKPCGNWIAPTPYDYTAENPSTWDGNASVYEWDGIHGEIGPEFPELEIQLFGKPAEREESQGIDFSK